MYKKEKKIRGVNLGGWLVLEKWMTPALFDGIEACDETTFSQLLTPELLQRLTRHREKFIREEDFEWISKIGLNTVRIPVPHWIFGDVPPYIGCHEYLEKGLLWASKYKLDVIVDLHCAPGCQNGFDNGGILGVCEWHKKTKNIEKTLLILDRICDFCRRFDCVSGIEILNEPHWDIDVSFVKDFYLKGYKIIRKHFKPDEAAVVMHDNFKSDKWHGFMQDDCYDGIILDAHLYQFQDEYKVLDISGHSKITLIDRDASVKELASEFDTIIGEWSLGYPPEFINSLDAFDREVALRAFAANQLSVYEQSKGWVFWNYKLDNAKMEPWDFRKCVEKGWLMYNF